MINIEDRIKYTRQGYNYIKVTPLENIQWGGMCICNTCGKQFIHEDLNLVFVLGDTYCDKCFNEWEQRANTYEEDLAIQNERSLDWYRYHIEGR